MTLIYEPMKYFSYNLSSVYKVIYYVNVPHCVLVNVIRNVYEYEYIEC